MSVLHLGREADVGGYEAADEAESQLSLQVHDMSADMSFMSVDLLRALCLTAAFRLHYDFKRSRLVVHSYPKGP